MSELAANIVRSDYYWLILLAGNVPVFFLAGYAFFDSWRGLFHSIFYLFKPDASSLFDGELHEDHFETARIGFFLFACAALIISEHVFLQSKFGQP